ncbi:N-acetylmuramidase domain-containing protein [Azospirillum sp.]|uniref:N-acetylmuramidase domain-containing protein n=1 Tax=Azospirillum sp. TaxID=34012 RepID=UPI003D72A48D
MPYPFSGAATPIGADDVLRVAESLGVEPAVVRAVDTVETGGVGGFLSDGSGRPRILVEAHLFSATTGRRWDASHPGISAPTWNRALYRGGAAEYLRLAEAVDLDREAALKAASWGRFQILGGNHRMVGFDGVEGFVVAMADDEGNHLEAFAEFCRAARLVNALRDRDWETFARRYNGPQYARNRYHLRLAAAYADAVGRDAAPGNLLRLGSAGPAVRRLQATLNLRGAGLLEDGAFGRVTELAVMRFQDAHGLLADGIVGPVTAAALGLPPAHGMA